jgi:transposase
MDEQQNLSSTQNLQESSDDGGVSDPLPPTAKIGRYTILGRVGKGGFGQVLLACDEDLDRSVEIKVPRPERVSRPESVLRKLASQLQCGVGHVHATTLSERPDQPGMVAYRTLHSGPKSGGRPALYERREIVNALLYLDRTGCQWRALPHDLPPWEAVYWYFRNWKKDGTLDRLHDELRGDLRTAESRLRQPSAAVIDSQTVRTTEKGGPKATTAVRGSRAASGTSSSTRWA